MRSKHKSWQNARHGWTRRIIWFEEKDVSIRLKMEDADYGIHNMFFSYDQKVIAQSVFNFFKDGLSIPNIKTMEG